MKKKFAALLCGAAFAFSSICSATIAPDKIALGRAVPGMNINHLISIYGQPMYRDGKELTFRNFEVELDDDDNSIVREIKTKSGAIATPSGVRVGQSESVLYQAFGNPDRYDDEYEETEYEYYSDDYARKLEITVVNGVITKIECQLRELMRISS